MNLSNFLFDNRNSSIFGLNTLAVAAAVAAGQTSIGGLQRDGDPTLGRGSSMPVDDIFRYKSGIMDMHNLFNQLDMGH